MTGKRMIMGRLLLAVCLMLGIGTEAAAKDQLVKKVYMFGFAASFNDSTVYFTDIQEVTGAYADVKTRFLTNRSEYSYQLRNYLKTQNVAQPTCVTSYAYDRKKIEKKYAKMMKRYTEKAKNRYIVKTIPAGDFQFQGVTPNEGTVNVDPDEAAAAARKSKEGRPAGPRPGGKPGKKRSK